MNCKKTVFLLSLFLLVNVFVCKAIVFTVTSNADSGTGSLRDALTQAAAAGNALGTNYIYFNLPGTDAASRTITLQTALPFITSSLIIDGTTQPGTALCANGANVIVQALGQVPSTTYCFEVHDAPDFEIYGMIVREFFSIAGAGSYTGGGAIALLGTSAKVIIGAVNKGNVFYDNGTAINNFPVVAQPVESNITYCEIKSNYIGIMENGFDFSLDVQSAVVLSYTHQAVIGGDTPAEGNVIVGAFSLSPYYDGINFTVKNNLFDVNTQYVFNPSLPADAEQAYFNSNVTTSTLPSQINVVSNVFATTVTVTKFNNLNIQFQSNLFGTTPDRKTSFPILGPALGFSGVQGTILVGGPDVSLGNVFTDAVQGDSYKIINTPVVQSLNSNTVELSHNSFYCNNNSPFGYLNTTPTNKPMQATINALSATTASGTSKPGARVELFYTDKECQSCQPKTFIGYVNADAGGNWVYNTAFTPGFGVMVGATLNKVSSEFTDPRLYENNIAIQNETCTSLGSITGALVINGALTTWIGPNGPVNNNNNSQLLNAPAGNYMLEVNQFGCIKYSMTYTILDQRPLVNDNARTITPATCSSSNGSITGLEPNTNIKSVLWLDAGGNIVGDKIDLLNVPAGAYTLQLIGEVCTNTYGPVTIGVKTDLIVITPGSEQNIPDQCSLHTGSIKGIKITGGMPPYTYAWVNSDGATIGTGADIGNLGSGTYTLKVMDALICDSTSATYVVDNSNNVIDPPLVDNIKVCGYDAILRVTHPASGYRYRLYGTATSTTPLDEQVSGVFNIKLIGNINFYYVTQLIGSCESDRTKVEAQFSTEPFAIDNAFTPNNDGINDYWNIKGLDAYPAALVQVFNRYGQRVFQSTGYAKPFDGEYNGSKLPSGVYYYIINVGSSCNLLSGSLTIIR